MMARRGPAIPEISTHRTGRLSCKGRKNHWIVSCLVTLTSYSTALPPRPPRPPTCPMQLVSRPPLALPTSCVLRHVESRARGKPQHCSAGKHARQLRSTAPDVLPPCNGMLLTYPVPQYNIVLSHTQRQQNKRHLKHHHIPSRVTNLS